MTQTPVISAGDTAWVLASSALVLLMTVGLAFSTVAGPLEELPQHDDDEHRRDGRDRRVVGPDRLLARIRPGTPWLGDLSWVMFKGVGLDPNPYAPTIPHQAHAIYQAMLRSSRPR